MSRRKAKHEAHVRLYRHELQSDAYRSLSTDARALLVEFRALYDGRANRIPLSIREMRRRLNVGQIVAQRARDELLDRGFIRLLTKGSFTRKALRATEYALTNEPVGNDLAPKDFMRWGQKNAVLMTNTGGTDGPYREKAEATKNTAHGTDDQYRKGQNAHAHGTDDQYTDKLPPEGRSGWLSKYGGWPCRNKSVLNACCLICGVWITSGRYEFDGAKHSCDPVSRAQYRERLEAAKGNTAVAA